MRNTVTLALIVAAFGGEAAAGSPAIRRVMGTSGDRDMLALDESGTAHISVRETRVALEFASGKTGRGTLLVIFAPATGYYVWIVDWERQDYPKVSQFDRLAEGRMIIGQMPHGLSILEAAPLCPFLFIRETSEKAPSIDIAEQESLQRANQHLADIESRSNLYRKAYIDMRGAWSAGFIPDGPTPEICLPIKLVRAERRSGRWEFLGKFHDEARWVLTYEAGFKVKVTIADGITCQPSQMGCPGFLVGLACIDEQGRDKACPGTY